MFKDTHLEELYLCILRLEGTIFENCVNPRKKRKISHFPKVLSSYAVNVGTLAFSCSNLAI